MNDYGLANRYNFDDPNKWVTVPEVPLLDEHEMTGEDGQPIAYVDRHALQEIADNNNRKVRETGDPATLILGHNSDDPRVEEKPAQGFVVNYKVKPFKRNQDGQIIFAIHGDYKLRPNKAHLVEEYPRRSVELWWAKKDIDPIALLGGSSPERDLGVLVRHARLNHVSMGVSNTTSVRDGLGNLQSIGDEVIRFSTRGNYTIETYCIEDVQPTIKYAKKKKETSHEKGKMHKVMNEFKKGKLKSGSKHGPQVTSRKQAIAIGMSEAGMSNKKKRNSRTPTERVPSRYAEMEDDDGRENEYHMGREHSQHMRYADDEMNTEDYDGGNEAVPTDEQDDTGGANNAEYGGGEPETDPVLAKVFQSKQWHQMSSGINQIKEMLEGLMGGAGSGMGEEEPGMEEMPPPGAEQPGMGQAPPPGAEAMGEEEPGEGEPEEDEREMHGQHPVRMNQGMSTGMPGPSSGYIPNFEGKRKQPHSRESQHMQRTPTRMDRRDKIIRDLRIQLARNKAEKDISNLENEGILFGPDPQTAQRIKYARTEELTLAYLHDEDSADDGAPDTYVKDKIEEMRVCYARRRPEVTRQRNGPVSRYARSETQVTDERRQDGAEADEDFEDKLGEAGDFQAVNEFASILASGKTRQEAIKFCRKKYNIR